MNDRFKFRVWDIEDCTYFEPRDFDDLWLNENAELRVGFYSDATQMIEDYTDNVIIEQCTGLKDKNGNLIYEGDVVRFEIVDNDSVLGKTFERICEICFGKGDYSYSFVCKNDAYYHGYALLSSILCQEIESIEIIGNIHEQAEQKDKRCLNRN